MSVTHTQTPWRAECWTSHAPRTILADDASTITGRLVVAECERDEDAAFIVRASNSHDRLVGLLREARASLDHEFNVSLVADIDAALAAAGE